MREIYYNSDITPNSLNEIKLLSLYYDKVYIVSDAMYRPEIDPHTKEVGVKTLRFVPFSFEQEYKLLLDEGIVELTERKDNEHDEYENKFAEEISEIVNSNFNFLFPNHPTESDGKIITEEVYDIMKSVLDFDWGKPPEISFMWWYYAFKLKWSAKLMLQGKKCLVGSSNLDHLFREFISKTESSFQSHTVRSQSKSLALDALKLSLPNPANLTFEDILELKRETKDELSYFAQTLNHVESKNKQLFDGNLTESEYQAIFFSEVQKPFIELETRMKNLKSKTFRQFVEKLKDPKSYAPLLGTMVASIPLHYGVLASIGLTGGQTYAEFKEGQREIQNNGLYFLLKLR